MIENFEPKENLLLKNVFLFTRDVHFKPTNLGFKPKSVEESINFVLQTKSGNCSAKHYLLGCLLQYYGIKVKYLTYPFYWHDLQIFYPDNISQLLPELPIQYHLALSVLTDKGEWLLDATWDKGLLFAGFPVNELDNMRLGIIPCEKPVVHFSAQERWDYIEELKKQCRKAM